MSNSLAFKKVAAVKIRKMNDCSRRKCEEFEQFRGFEGLSRMVIVFYGMIKLDDICCERCP